MSCNSCVVHVLRTFLGHFDIVVPPTRITSLSPSPSPKPLFRSSCSPANRVPCHSIQRRTYRTESPLSRSPPVEERKVTRSNSQTKKPGHDNGGFSGIGHVGQQTKDLQEHVASIAEIPVRTVSSEKGSQKKSVSTPARLARRERRMPSRRFKGDRARPEMKEKATAKTAIKKRETKPQAARFSTTLRKVNSPSPDIREERSFGHEIRARRPRMESGRVQQEVVGENSQETELATASKKEKSPLRKPSEDKGFVGETEEAKPSMEPWGIQKKALEKKFGEQSWLPRKRLSPDALEGIRTLHAQYPDAYTTPVLAQHFKVSPENIRRILKSKWRPSEEEEEDRRRRWEKRGEGIWAEMAAKGVKPPKPWREKGIGKLSELRGRSPSFATLEEQIGMECAKDVVTTRIVSEQGKEGSLANVIL